MLHSPPALKAERSVIVVVVVVVVPVKIQRNSC
jgi:hypothetical protein